MCIVWQDGAVSGPLSSQPCCTERGPLQNGSGGKRFYLNVNAAFEFVKKLRFRAQTIFHGGTKGMYTLARKPPCA